MVCKGYLRLITFKGASRAKGLRLIIFKGSSRAKNLRLIIFKGSSWAKSLREANVTFKCQEF